MVWCWHAYGDWRNISMFYSADYTIEWGSKDGTAKKERFDLIAWEGRGQIHAYGDGRSGNAEKFYAGQGDQMNLIFRDITKFSYGHHVWG